MKRAMVWTFGAIAISAGVACQHSTVRMPGSEYRPVGMVAVFSQSDWATVLTRVATPDGYVRWTVFDDAKSAARASLIRYVALLSVVSPDNRPDLFEIASERTAYWINAYNALSMYDHLLHGTGNPANGADDFFRVGNRSLTLDDIENRRLSARTEPRILFALNRCTRSSPPLRSEPYAPAKINALLNDQAVRCLRDARFVNVQTPVVLLSRPLLVEHQQDFVDAYQRKNGSAGTFIEAMKQLAGRDCIFSGASRVEELPYDASLNTPPTAAAH